MAKPGDSICAVSTTLSPIGRSICKLHTGDTHVLCAHRLADLRDPRLHDCVDDGEHGGGRVVLKMLCDRQIVNKGVFVARKFAGIHLFDMRYQ